MPLYTVEVLRVSGSVKVEVEAASRTKAAEEALRLREAGELTFDVPALRSLAICGDTVVSGRRNIGHGRTGEDE